MTYPENIINSRDFAILSSGTKRLVTGYRPPVQYDSIKIAVYHSATTKTDMILTCKDSKFHHLTSLEEHISSTNQKKKIPEATVVYVRKDLQSAEEQLPI